jgi:hypothetical protein
MEADLIPGQPGLVQARLERTRDVLRELLRSLKQALPIVAGVAGPIFVASLALLAWAGVPPMRAVALPWREGVPLWCAQALLAAWPLWALRRRLLPEAWCVQLRCLPIAAGALWVADLVVSAAILAPLAALYAVSVVAFALHRPAWWVGAWPLAIASLLASWAASWLLGGAALAWQRRAPAPHARRAAQERTPAQLLAARPRLFAALLWTPWWRGAMAPGGPGVAAGMAGAMALAAAWIFAPWPAVPGAAWALMFSALLVALTERAQRAMEGHLDRLGPWIAALPTDVRWRLRARALVCLPMAACGLAAVAAVLVLRPWRALPLACFAAGLVAVPVVLTAVPSANREAHVGLWAVGTGLLTALGSELWN